MAITRVKKLGGRSYPKDGIDSREYLEKYLVLSNSKDDRGDTIREASHGGVTIPRMHEEYPDDPGALVVRVFPREESSNGVDLWKWIVDVEYSSNADAIARSGGSSGGSNDPLDMRWQRRWSTRTVSEPVEKAIWVYEGTEFPENPIATSPLGEVFDPGIEENKRVAVLTIVRNQSTFNTGVFFYLDKCASGSFYGFEPGEALMADIQATEKFKGDLAYAEVTYEIEFKAGGWDREILNQGYWYNDANGNAVKTDKETLRLIDLQSGQILPPGESQYAVFRTKPRVDFGPLNLE